MTKPRPSAAIVFCLALPVLLGIALRWPRPNPPVAPEPAATTGRLNPIGLSQSPDVSRPVFPAPIHRSSVVGSTLDQPWWALLTPEDVQARREDYEFMYNRPGAFPEFSEITRQLRDAGVPEEVVWMESRGLFGILHRYQQYQVTSDELQRAADTDTSPTLRDANRTAARDYGDRADDAQAEVRARLTENGVAPDSEPGRRILQLRPTTPLRPLPLIPAPGAGAKEPRLSETPPKP